MRVIVAGSRNITNLEFVELAIDHSKFDVSEVVSGCARGVDRLGEDWAVEHCIPIKRFIADWDRYGRGAGIMRNKEMADYADALVAVWDGSSPGTKNMINIMQRLDKPVHIQLIEMVEK